MASNYNSTAWFYDTLAKLVYGNRIKRAQTEFLHLIPKNSRVLIVGGGTGWILEEIAKIHPSGLIIYYVEISERMIALSKERNVGHNQVIFITKPIEEFEVSDMGVVITPFLFDNHISKDAKDIFNHIDQMVTNDAIWLNTDFQLTGKWWQEALLKSMLLFFKLLGAVSNNQITDMQPVFESAGYRKITAKNFYSDFIRTDVWQ